MNDEFWGRRKFFDAYGPLPGQQLAGAPPRGVRVTCPCCGYPTLGDRGNFEICRLCSWEDDGQDTPQADEVWGGPNHGYYLVEARSNFERLLVMYCPEDDPRMEGPDSEHEKKIKRIIMTAFEEMMKNPPAAELESLWQLVYEHEQALYQELKRRVSGLQYEAVPCPYCGAPLRTRAAKQCRKCLKDWHDPDNVLTLGNAQFPEVKS